MAGRYGLLSREPARLDDVELTARVLDGHRLSDEQEERIVAALIAISAGEEDVQSLPVRPEIGARLLAWYLGWASN